MRVLHTADWHLGRRLYGKERKAEFQSFLQWLLEVLRRESVDCLVVAGDVFDSAMPPLWAQRLYFDFLWRLRQTGCRWTVIIAGNHDSPALLDSPRELLEYLGVWVRGLPSQDPGDEILALRNSEGDLELIVYADPFLRTRDLCPALQDEDPQEQRRRALEALGTRYSQAMKQMVQLRGGAPVPMVAMGHLFAAGGRMDGEERDLAVGSLDFVPLDLFPSELDYLALGHIHRSQRVGKRENWRYSGSPIAMGFSEVGQRKEVLLVDFEGSKAEVRGLEVPCFHRLARLEGSPEKLEQDLQDLCQKGEPLWLELSCAGKADPGLWERFQQIIKGSAVEILRLRSSLNDGPLLPDSFDLMEDWSPEKVFEALLTERQIAGPEARDLMALYRQVLEDLRQEEAP